MSKQIAVIILNWNGEELIKRFLPSVCKYTNSDIADVIIADNGSTDNSVEIIKHDFPKAKLLCLGKNHGYAEGYNIAIEETNYKYTLLLNSDVEVREGWLEPLYEFMEENEDTAACQPKILSCTNPNMFEYAGAAGGYIDNMGYLYCRGRLFDTIEPDEGQYNQVEDIFWASGAALMVRTEVYLRVGGLDGLFFAHMEEIDLCWRINLEGYKIKYLPNSAIYHLGGGTLEAGNPRKTFLNFRNNLLLLYKNLPKKVRDRKLFARRLYDTLAFFMFLAKREFRNAGAVLKAHKDFRRMKRLYTPPKDIANLLKGNKNAERNVIIEYFLQGRKRFSDLK
ncbi:MAG: glycosyltransferase family 2 protein [Bacteroidales bacterium]